MTGISAVGRSDSAENGLAKTAIGNRPPAMIIERIQRRISEAILRGAPFVSSSQVALLRGALFVLS